MHDRIAETFYSPEEVAELYGLHVRTVRRYIREGKLTAARIGNRYRITPADLEAFAGRPVEAAPPARPASEPQADVSTVVDVHPVSRELADRLTTLLLAAAGGRGDDDTLLRVDVVHDPSRDRLKVVVIGTIAHTSAVLALLNAYLEG